MKHTPGQLINLSNLIRIIRFRRLLIQLRLFSQQQTSWPGEILVIVLEVYADHIRFRNPQW